MRIKRYITRGVPRENVGSLARDHLANERTFLSWMRTALAFVGLGILTVELVESEGAAAEILGLALIVLGAVAAIASTSRFLRVNHQLDRNSYQSSTIGPVLVGVMTVLVAIAGLIFAIT